LTNADGLHQEADRARSSSPLDLGTAALVVAHPGHELRVYGWLQAARPTVFILTDGSGKSGKSRLPSTLRVLEETGSRPGAICGRLTDGGLYRALLRLDFKVFVDLAAELAEQLVDEALESVLADSAEGYNPAHDVCRLIVNSAIELANHRRKRPISNFDFPVTKAPDDCAESLRSRSVWLHLDDETFLRKIAAARRYVDLRADIDDALNELGVDAFRTECLRPFTVEMVSRAETPLYEKYGEQRVGDGHYTRVIRYREHVYPLELALADYVGSQTK
jgi:hypothetical protein